MKLVHTCTGTVVETTPELAKDLIGKGFVEHKESEEKPAKTASKTAKKGSK